MLEPPLLVGTSDSDISSQFIPSVEEEVLSFEAFEGSTAGNSGSFDSGMLTSVSLTSSTTGVLLQESPLGQIYLWEDFPHDQLPASIQIE
ncbi:hypothetical protein A2U01_0047386 [Trifolium medium]|uniref:Uncharacterized protein n=1 Tax=Trifolium medium TaxID=97028 RepID=A0A392QP73_9FABA|nr:hypothetical protein [Trifolium medium]